MAKYFKAFEAQKLIFDDEEAGQISEEENEDFCELNEDSESDLEDQSNLPDFQSVNPEKDEEYTNLKQKDNCIQTSSSMPISNNNDSPPHSNNFIASSNETLSQTVLSIPASKFFKTPENKPVKYQSTKLDITKNIGTFLKNQIKTKKKSYKSNSVGSKSHAKKISTMKNSKTSITSPKTSFSLVKFYFIRYFVILKLSGYKSEKIQFFTSK